MKVINTFQCFILTGTLFKKKKKIRTPHNLKFRAKNTIIAWCRNCFSPQGISVAVAVSERRERLRVRRRRHCGGLWDKRVRALDRWSKTCSVNGSSDGSREGVVTDMKMRRGKETEDEKSVNDNADGICNSEMNETWGDLSNFSLNKTRIRDLFIFKNVLGKVKKHYYNESLYCLK